MASITENNIPEVVTPVPFCAFCLREKPPNVEFYKQVVDSTAELRQSFQSMLGYDFQLANFSICKPCWKLMQLVQDFRYRCFTANSMVERISEGLRIHDDWFSVKNLATIESVRMVIKDQVAQFGRMSVSEEDQETGELTNQDQLEELTSTVEVGSIKIESVVSLNAEALEVDHAEDTGSDALCDQKQVLSECSKCGRLFSLEKSFKLHFLKCIGKPVSNNISCQICSATFTHNYQLEGHMNKHEGKTPFKCRKNCSKSFASKFVLRSHESRCVTDHKKCDLCEEKFTSTDSLKEHYKLVHHAEKKFACKMCDIKCNRLYDLHSHIRLKHAKNVPKYPCPICGKQFAFQHNVKPHIEQVHSRQRGHQCEICNKRFTNRTCLQIHGARFHPESATEYARTLLARKQERMRQLVKKKADQNAENLHKMKKSLKTLHDFEGFGVMES